LVTPFADHSQQFLSFLERKFDFMFCHPFSLYLPLIFSKLRYSYSVAGMANQVWMS